MMVCAIPAGRKLGEPWHVWLPSAGKGSQGRTLGICVEELQSGNSSLGVWRSGDGPEMGGVCRMAGGKP